MPSRRRLAARHRRRNRNEGGTIGWRHVFMLLGFLGSVLVFAMVLTRPDVPRQLVNAASMPEPVEAPTPLASTPGVNRDSLRGTTAQSPSSTVTGATPNTPQLPRQDAPSLGLPRKDAPPSTPAAPSRGACPCRPTYVFVAAVAGTGHSHLRAIAAAVADAADAASLPVTNVVLDVPHSVHFDARHSSSSYDDNVKRFRKAIPQLTYKCNACAAPTVLWDTTSPYPFTTHDFGLERPDLPQLLAMHQSGVLNLRVVFVYTEPWKAAVKWINGFSKLRKDHDRIVMGTRMIADQLQMLQAGHDLLDDHMRLVVDATQLDSADTIERLVRHVFTGADEAGIAAVVSHTVENDAVASAVPAMVDATPSGAALKDVQTFFGERKHLWHSLSGMESPGLRLKRVKEKTPPLPMYLLLAAPEGAGHHLVGEWLRHQRPSCVKSKYYACHSQGVHTLDFSKYSKCFAKRTTELNRKYKSKRKRLVPYPCHYVEHQCSYPFDYPRNALRRPDITRVAKLHGKLFDLRVILLYRDIVSTVLSKAADGNADSDSHGATRQGRIIESNLVALNASATWLPEWMVLRLRYEDVLKRPQVAQQRLSAFLGIKDGDDVQFGLKNLQDMMAGHKKTNKRAKYTAVHEIEEYFLGRRHNRTQAFRLMWDGLDVPPNKPPV